MWCVWRMCEMKGFFAFISEVKWILNVWKWQHTYDEKDTLFFWKIIGQPVVCKCVFLCFLPFTEIYREVKCKTTNMRTGPPSVSWENTHITTCKPHKMLPHRGDYVFLWLKRNGEFFLQPRHLKVLPGALKCTISTSMSHIHAWPSVGNKRL